MSSEIKSLLILVVVYVMVFSCKKYIAKRFEDDKNYFFINPLIDFIILKIEEPLLATVCIYPGIVYNHFFGGYGYVLGTVIFCGIWLYRRWNKPVLDGNFDEFNFKIKCMDFIDNNPNIIKLFLMFAIFSGGIISSKISIAYSQSVLILFIAYLIFKNVMMIVVGLFFGVTMALINRKNIAANVNHGEITSQSNEVFEADKEFSETLQFPWIEGNTPSDEEMKDFFTPDIVSKRLIYCQKINIDQTDDWGMFGYEEGFIFIETLRRTGEHCFNDSCWNSGESVRESKEYDILEIPHYDFFPRAKFDFVIITKSRLPMVFAFLQEYLRK